MGLKSPLKIIKSVTDKRKKKKMALNEDLLEAQAPPSAHDDDVSTLQQEESSDDLNFFLRFAIEVSGAGALFGFGFALANLWSAILFVVLAGAIWILLQTNNDPIAPRTRWTLSIPGKLRFLLELLLYAAAGYGMYYAFSYLGVVVFAALVVVHVGMTTDRILWLLDN